ncbi:chemotaxis protein CheW [Brassicibacter mesophilus]|jgi:purine-binding chemotaxis protein CheW|uniref:chemotaxis protein CheW n=1 Tax=Brassicibacter mesophilus TaxID=745119 RepID=UPI003D214AEF
MNTTNIVEEKKYVAFKIDEEYYGIDINNVKAIERVQAFTRIPNAPEYVKGVINLRGEVVPVIDLRKRFGIDCKEIDSDSRIIIVLTNETLIGLLVDSSSEVMQLNSDSIDNPPEIKDNISDDFVKGVGKKDSKLIILIDIEKVIGYRETELIN